VSSALVRPLPRGLVPVLGVLALGFAFGAMRLLANAESAVRPDLALKLTFVAALPLPLGLLGLLTTPPHAGVRRMLGESAPAQLDRSLRSVGLWLGLALLVPAGVAAMGYGHTATSEASHDFARASAVMASGLLLTAGLGVAGLLAALDVVGRGGNAVWSAVSGGGAFGPAQAAPLLYAPALALIAALVPPALFCAVWGAKASLASLDLGLGLVVFSAVAAGLAARRQVRAVRPRLQDALLATEEAHAVRFAESRHLPEPPAWLRWSPAPAHARFLARSWVRQAPAVWLGPVVLVGLAWLLAPRPAPWPVLLLGATLAGRSGARVLELERGATVAALSWLGTSAPAVTKSLRMLAFALTWPALLLFVLAYRQAPPGVLFGALALGLGLGTLLPALLAPGLRAVWPRLTLLAYGIALAAATALQ